MPSFPLLLQLFGIQICQIRCLAVFQEFGYINPEIFTDDDSLPDLPFQVTPQAQKPVDKDTSPIMISSSEPDDSSPLKPTSPVAGPSSLQPMASSPRPFETGLLNKTSSPKLNMPKLGERYAFYYLIILIIIA